MIFQYIQCLLKICFKSTFLNENYRHTRILSAKLIQTAGEKHSAHKSIARFIDAKTDTNIKHFISRHEITTKATSM